MTVRPKGRPPATTTVSNAEIADRLASLAQLLSAQKENPFKVKAYRRAAKTLRSLPDSIDALVRADADLTQYPGIGKAISSAIREIVLSGSLGQLERLRSEASPELVAISEYPKLDPVRVLRVFKKLNISSVAALKEKLASGEVRENLGANMDQHVRLALTDSHEIILYEADTVAAPIEKFLLSKCGVGRAQVTGDYRRRVEVIGELSFLIETDDFQAVLSNIQNFGGKTEVLSAAEDSAVCKLPSGVSLRLQTATKQKWGISLITSTGSEEHLKKLEVVCGDLSSFGARNQCCTTEASVYRKLGLTFIEPELREGHDEVELAARGALPTLVSQQEIRGELHAHSVSSDGSNTIEEMAEAAQKKGYQYLGITDHSQSLKIAGGVSGDALRKQIRFIDKLNRRFSGFRILKSAEVDILADGSLDYSDEILKELDYTVCSIHSKFNLSKREQTDRILRAMDNRFFTILGHPTGRLLLKRSGYEIDMGLLIEQAQKNGCFFEINSSPDRLDLSAENARMVRLAGVKIAISTDAHSIREYAYIRCGIDQARRAGLESGSILNCLSLAKLQRVMRR